MEQLFVGVFIFLFGLALGSFFGAVSYRVPRGISIVTPPSACPQCKHRLGLADLVPVLSHALSRGRCRHCGEPVPFRYSIIEVVTGIGFVGAYAFALWLGSLEPQGFASALGFPIDGWAFAVAVVLYSLLLVMTVIDLEHMLLPDKINLAGGMAGLGIALAGGGAVTPLQAVYGALLGYGIILLIVLLSRGGMGMGDAKFLAMIGTFVGPMGVLYTLFGASVFGSIVGGLLIWLGRHGRKVPIPFGPFLAAAALGVWVYLSI